MPSQRNSSNCCSAIPGLTRGRSMSSTRNRYAPFPLRAHCQESKAVRALPRWSSPVGLGADVVGEEAVEHFESLALRGDTAALVAQLAAMCLRGYELAEIFDDVVAPALRRIGDRWAGSKLSVADEHVASQAVIDAIARAQ